MSPKRSCGGCSFFYDAFPELGEGGICRRFPPVIMMNSILGRNKWPAVKDLDWCGEFVQRPLSDEEAAEIRREVEEERKT
jgi:hypothetical protein